MITRTIIWRSGFPIRVIGMDASGKETDEVPAMIAGGLMSLGIEFESSQVAFADEHLPWGVHDKDENADEIDDESDNEAYYRGAADMKAKIMAAKFDALSRGELNLESFGINGISI